MHASEFTLYNIFSLAGGLALFLYGMQQGEKNLRRIGGANLRKAVSAITKNRFFSYCAGFLTTLITQSSSATTVLLVGLVNASIMTLGQSLGMILGADLATTLTVQLFVFKFYEIAPLLIAAGLTATLNKSNMRFVLYGKLVFALGLIFFGMHQMALAVTPLRSLDGFSQAITASLANPLYGLVAGTLITAIIHSSAATLTIVITLLQSQPHSAVSAAALLPVVMGANLGTCVTAFLSAFGTDVSAKRVAWSHFMFKLVGVAFLFPLVYLLPLKINALVWSTTPAVTIALLHTIFNVVLGCIFLPILSPFEKIIKKIIRMRPAPGRYHVQFINDSFVNMPAIAFTQTIREIIHMGDCIQKMMSAGVDLIKNTTVEQAEFIKERDDEVDFIHEHIVAFLTKMSLEELDEKSANKSYQLLMMTTDLEHIGDCLSKNITLLADKKAASTLPLSHEGVEEILEYLRHTIDDFSLTLAILKNRQVASAGEILSKKPLRDEMYSYLFNRHLARLFDRKPESLQTTSIHIDLLEEIRKISHYIFRITEQITRLEPTALLRQK